MKKILALFSMILALLLVSSCARTNEREVFRFEAHQLEMKIGEEMKLELILGSIDPDEEIRYFVDKEGIVELNGNVCKAISNGVVKVTAQVVRIPTTKATVEITVNDEKLSGMVIIGKSELEMGQEDKFRIETYPNYIESDVLWSSSRPDIVSIDAKGNVKGLLPGTSEISAQSKYDGTIIAKKTVKVLYQPTERIELVFEVGNENIIVGQTITLKATVYPEHANQTLSWTTSKGEIASIKPNSGNGTCVVSGLKVDTNTSSVKITVKTVDNVESSVEVRVVYPDATEVNITANVDPVQVIEEKKITLKAEVLPSNAEQVVTWASSDESIATVNSSGVVTGVKKGTVIITATSSDGKAVGEIEVTVTGRPDPENIIITYGGKPITELEIEESFDESVTISIRPLDAIQDFECVVGDEDMISIKINNNRITIYGDKIGDTTLTIKSAEKEEIQAVLVVHVIPLE